MQWTSDPMTNMKRIVVTGGIACGKTRFGEALRALGVETLDADDIVHELVPEEERRRLAKIAFTDATVRAALEKRLHPLVAARFDEWFGGEGSEFQVSSFKSQGECGETRNSKLETRNLKVAIIPLLFEVHWEEKYDIICAVICSKEKQIERMMQRRGLSRQEAEDRLAAQMPTEEKAAKSHYVIRNEGTTEQLERQAAEFVSWLENGNDKETRQQ